MKRIIFSVAIWMLILIAAPRPAAAQASSGPYLGEIQMFAFNFCPMGWAQLAGQLLPISQNAALYNLIGTQYGGDGTTTFALPKWGPIVTANGQPLTACIALVGTYPTQN